MQATDGRPTGRPTVEIEGRQYRVHRLRVREMPLTRIVPSGRPGWVFVETLEPVGGR